MLLVDALASSADGDALRRELEDRRGLRVRRIVVTHYMSDHIGGLHLFPGAEIVAHPFWRHTYMSQQEREPDDDARLVAPTTLVSTELLVPWGDLTLRVFHNPSKTVCALAVDVPAVDLLVCGDAIVGNIVYLSSSEPALLRAGLDTLLSLGRSTVIPGHIGVFPGRAVENARIYLRELCRSALPTQAQIACGAPRADVGIETCLAPGVVPCEFEREWHSRNLDVIEQRRLFRISNDAAVSRHSAN